MVPESSYQHPFFVEQESLFQGQVPMQLVLKDVDYTDVDEFDYIMEVTRRSDGDDDSADSDHTGHEAGP